MPKPDRPLSYWIAVARLGFEEDLVRLMDRKDVHKTDLAKAAAVSPPFITKLLNGSNNYTLKTMVKLARAVGAVLEVRLADEGEVVRVLDLTTATNLEAPRVVPSQSVITNNVIIADFKNSTGRRVEAKALSQDIFLKATGEFNG